MSDDVSVKSIDAIAIELREEFIDATRDSLVKLDGIFEEMYREKITVDALIDATRRAIIPISGQASNYNMYSLSTVALRLEDFLADVKNISSNYVSECQKFLDMMMDIIEGRIASDADMAELVRTLPAKASFDETQVDVRDVEVLLVMLHGTSTHFVEREMQACGYRTSTLTSTFDALPQIVQTQPDMVIISAMMPNLSGIDLAVALSNMPATRNVPCALITSLDKDDMLLQFLPDSVPVIKKGPSFGDDLADALSDLFLL